MVMLMSPSRWSILLVVMLITRIAWCAESSSDDAVKPRVLFLPLTGDASDKLREDAGFALRAKLDRTKLYEVIDGFAVNDLMNALADPIAADASDEQMRTLGSDADAQLVAWGSLTGSGPWTWQMKVLDVRQPGASKNIEMNVEEKQDFRFAAEHVVEAFPGVRSHTYVTEESVTLDETSQRLWEANPNLLPEGDFSKPESWFALYLKEKYNPPVSTVLPDEDKVVTYEEGEGENKNAMLAMKLSRWCAENPGLACISREIAIEPTTRYRLSFRYKSDAPVLHVFVKGYTRGKNIAGQEALREVYRRQVPPSGATDGKWVTVLDDLNPQHVAFPVEFLKVDLYAYASPGMVLFDDVILKAVGQQTHTAKDDAIKPPTTRP